MTTSTRDYSRYMASARRRANAAVPQDTQNYASAWQVARRAALFIKEHYPGAIVRAFGSLLYPDSFGTRSDIDLAVEGVPWPDYLRMWSELERREPEFHIDLVDLGLVSTHLREVIEREGKTL